MIVWGLLKPISSWFFYARSVAIFISYLIWSLQGWNYLWLQLRVESDNKRLSGN